MLKIIATSNSVAQCDVNPPGPPSGLLKIKAGKHIFHHLPFLLKKTLVEKKTTTKNTKIQLGIWIWHEKNLRFNF